MRQWTVLFRKEMLELWRSYKWLWVPLVFVGLGIMQPASTYYLPEIIDMAGGLPEGAVIEIPSPAPGAVLAEALGQLNTIGILVLVLAGMGTVVGERTSGTAALVLVKPVSHAAFITAKWAAYALLALVSAILGQLAAWYYTGILIGDVPFGTMLASAMVFAIWLAFVIAVLITVSAVLRSAAAAAFLTLGAAIALALVTSFGGNAMSWSPSRLAAWATAILTGTEGDLIVPLAMTLVLGPALLFLGAALFRRQRFSS